MYHTSLFCPVPLYPVRGVDFYLECPGPWMSVVSGVRLLRLNFGQCLCLSGFTAIVTLAAQAERKENNIINVE